MSEKKKLVFFLPNIFTALNMGCGFAAIVFATKEEFYKSCMLLILGAFFDSVDGRLARLTGTASAFGEQFDSLSDLISFGMAPALLFYHRFLFQFGRLGLILSFIFVLCGALRLARFNANISKVNPNFFQGLPIPSGAMALIGLVLFSQEFSIDFYFHYGTPVYIVFYALLMVSNIPFPSFKKSAWVVKHKKQVLMIIFLILASLFLYEQVMVLSLMTAYIFSSLIYFMTHRGELSSVFDWVEHED